MKKKEKELGTSSIRFQAEELLKNSKQVDPSILSKQDAMKLIHELQVHQIELELQNDEIIRIKSDFHETLDKHTELYDFAPVGYFTLSPQAEILELNFNGSIMLGKKRSLLLNKTFTLFVSDESKADFKKFLTNVFNQDKIRQHCDIRIISNGLIKLHINLSGIKHNTNGKCLVTAIDISQRIDALEMLQKSEDELTEYFKNDISADCVISGDGEIINCNKTFIELFGLEKVLNINKLNIKSFYKDPFARDEILKLVKEKGSIENYVVEYITNDSRTIDTLVNVIGIFNEFNELIKTRVYILDNTVRKKAEGELKIYREHLEDLVKERTFELVEKNLQLENFNNLFIGREFRIKELRDKNKELKQLLADK